MEGKLLENLFTPAISLHGDKIVLKIVAFGVFFPDGSRAEVLN